VSSDSGVLLEVGNEPPAIELAFGNGNGSFFRDDGSVDYRILVTDAEDGSSADGGIDARRVTVSVEYIPQGEDLANAQLGHQAAGGIDGWAEIESRDCLSCHAREKESVGPSFTAVAERYAGQAGINEQLAEKIVAGTSGEWGDYSMPPHTQMSAQQATAMASWIVDPDAPTATTAGLPLTGTIRFDQHGDDFIEAEMMGRLYTGRYLLMVSYTDGGAPGAHPQRASATHIWRPSIIDVTAADGLQAIMKMPVPMEEMRGVSVGIYRSTMSKAGWVMLKNIDLSGISTVRVGLATTSLFTTGGELALRRDGPDGPVIGRHLVENANLGMPENQDYYDFDVSELEARHTLYLISESEITEDRARPEFILGTLEFLP
jgi:cytochrome c